MRCLARADGERLPAVRRGKPPSLGPRLGPRHRGELGGGPTQAGPPGPALPGLVVSSRRSTPTSAGGMVSTRITAAVATVTLPLSSADAYSMNEMIPAAASA